MVVGLTKGDKAAEAGSSQPRKHFDVRPTPSDREVYYSRLIYYALKELCSQLNEDQGIPCVDKERLKKEVIDYCVLPQFARFKEIIDKDIEKDPSFASSAIMKFCCSIIEDNKLRRELEELSISAKNSGIKIIIDFQLKNLKEKMWFLKELKEKSDFAAIQKAYRDKWSFYDLINDKDFKQTYIDKAVTESANESFKEGIDKCIELAEQGKKAASKYFEREDVELRAYYTETDNAHRVLNVNLINYNRSEPTRISDILQQEKELNIYCNKKHEIHAHQEDKKRCYEFKEGAYYEMTSTWPVKDEFGNVSICTMIMNVSSDGITEILKFDSKDSVSSKGILELIKQNDELYIQGLSLHDAVMKSLEKGKAAGVVSTANNNFQNESIVAYQDKEPEGKLDPKVDDDNSLLPSPSINSTEVASQQMDELILNNQMLSEENIELKQEMLNLKKEAVELKQEIEVGLQVINKKHHELIQENQRLQKKLETTQAEANQTIVELEKQNSDLQSESEKAKQTTENLERRNSDLQNRFGKEEQKNTELQTELAQKNKKLAEVQKEKSDLEDKLNSLKQLNKKMNGNQKQLSEQVLDLQEKLSRLKEVNQALSNKSESAEAEKKEVNQKLAEAEQRIEELEKRNDSLQDELEKEEQKNTRLQTKLAQKNEELAGVLEELQGKAQELKSVCEEKRKLEDKLKIVNAGKKELEDKLKEFEEEIDQVVHIMEEKEQFISNLKYQMLGLENEYKAQLESYEQEIDKLKWEIAELENRHDELKEYVASTLESMDREHEDHVDGLEEEFNELGEIIGDKVWEIEGLMKELQDSKKEIEDLRNQVEMLSAETFADKQKGLNDQFYTLTGDISSEPDNASRKKIELSRSLSLDNESYVQQQKEKGLSRSSSVDSGLNNEYYVPLEEERKSLRSSSIDDGYGSDKENCDDDLSSNITTSSIEKVAESRNVGSSPFFG